MDPYTYDDEEPEVIEHAPNSWNNFTKLSTREELKRYFLSQRIPEAIVEAHLSREFSAHAPQHRSGEDSPGPSRAREAGTGQERQRGRARAQSPPPRRGKYTPYRPDQGYGRATSPPGRHRSASSESSGKSNESSPRRARYHSSPFTRSASPPRYAKPQYSRGRSPTPPPRRRCSPSPAQRRRSPPPAPRRGPPGGTSRARSRSPIWKARPAPGTKPSRGASSDPRAGPRESGKSYKTGGFTKMFRRFALDVQEDYGVDRTEASQRLEKDYAAAKRRDPSRFDGNAFYRRALRRGLQQNSGIGTAEDAEEMIEEAMDNFVDEVQRHPSTDINQLMFPFSHFVTSKVVD